MALDLDQHHMDAEIPKADLFRILRAFDAITDKVALQFKEDGLYAYELSNDRVATVRAAYTDVEYTTDHEAVSVGIELDPALSHVTFTSEDPTLSIRFTDGETDLTVTNGNYIDYVGLIDPANTGEREELSDLMEFDAEATVDATALKGAVGAVSAGSRKGVLLATEGDELVVAGSETKGDDYPFERRIDADTNGVDVTAAFSESLLGEFLRTIKPEGEVELAFNEGHPITLSTEAGVEYLLCPVLTTGAPEPQWGEE
jgi:hypothetical protein